MRDPAATAAPADDALVRRHYPWVRAAAMRQVRDAHLADDVAQAVFIVLMRKRPALMTHTTPAATAPLIATAVTGTTGAAATIAKGIAMTWTPAKIGAVALAVAVAVPAVATVGYLSLESASAPAPAAERGSGAGVGASAAEASPPAAPPPAAPQTAAAQTAAAQTVSQVDPIIPDHLLDIVISDLIGPGIVTRQRSRVNPDSNITLPLIGGVSVKDLTLDQAERAAQKAYRDQNLMPNAQIYITRVESGKAPSIR